MKEDSHGGQADEAQQQEAGSEDQAAQGEVTALSDGGGVGAAGDDGFEKAIAERDARIGELEAQVAEAARSAEAAEALRSEIAELREQSADERVEYELRLAGARNVTAAKALLAEHGGDVEALKEAEPWMFSAAAPAAGATGLPNAGAASDKGRTLRRWEKLAGLDQDDE